MKKNGGSFLARIIKGLVIGIAAMLPGASGGVLAVSMGVYKSALDAICSIFTSFIPSIRYLMPLGIGGLIGLFGTGRVVGMLMDAFRISVMWALIGMVLGGLPSLFEEANRRGFKLRYLFGTACGIMIILGTVVLQHSLTGGEALPFNGFTAALGGALIGLGTVIPGISTSFIMIYLGIYEPFLSAFNTLDIPMLLCAGAGALAVIVVLIAAVRRLFDKHYGFAYYGAIGLLLSSIVLIYPGLRTGWGIVIDALLFIACFIVTYLLCRLGGSEDASAADIIDNIRKSNKQNGGSNA